MENSKSDSTEAERFDEALPTQRMDELARVTTPTDQGPKQSLDPSETTDDRDYDAEYLDALEAEDDWPVCPTCHGAKTVNPLTAPPGFFCVSTTECPTCEGSGDCP